MGISISPHNQPNTVYYPEDPTSIKETLERIGVSPPNFEYCNSVRLTHGPTPSKCYFLLRKSEFVELQGIASDTFERFGLIVNVHQDESIVDQSNNVNAGIIRYKNWSVTDAKVILGHRDNPNSIVLITLEDVRYWLSRYSCFADFQNTPTSEFRDSYNVIRHTPKIYNGYAEDQIASSDDLNGYYFYKHTLKSSLLNNSQNTSKYELWNGEQIVKEVFSYWSSNIVNIANGVDAQILQDLVPMNLCVSNLTYLDFLTKMAEISKTYYYVDKDGKIIFDDKSYSYTSENLDYGIENLLGTTAANDLNFLMVVQEHCFNYSNNESDAIDRRFHIIGLASNSSIDLQPNKTYPFGGEPGKANITVNIPHLVRVRDRFWNNTSYISNYVSSRIGPRMTAMEYSEKNLFFRGFQHEVPKFGADLIIYGNYGSGLHTTVVGLPKYDIDYYTTKFEDHVQSPVVEYWRYVQLSNYRKPDNWDLEEPDPEAPATTEPDDPPATRIYNPSAICRLYYPANNKKPRYRLSTQEPEGPDVIVEDPLGTHINDLPGSKGVCIQVGQRFYVVESIAKKYFTWTLESAWTLDPGTGIWAARATIHDLATDKVIHSEKQIFDRLKMFTDQIVGDRGYCYYQPQMSESTEGFLVDTLLEYWAVNAPCEHWTGYD